MPTPSTPPAPGPFPTTRLSVLEAVRSDDAAARSQACERLASAYWKPVYKYLRLRWHASPEDAEDLAQGFFAAAFEKGFFERFDPARGRFRTFLRTCLDGFASKERSAARALKRGGGAALLPLDFSEAEGELVRQPPAPGTDLDEYFHREWMRALFEQAVESLRRRSADTGRGVPFAVFERYDLQRGDDALTYAEVASEMALPVTQVTNHLSLMRRELRRHLLEALRALCATEAEVRQEARLLLGREP